MSTTTPPTTPPTYTPASDAERAAQAAAEPRVAALLTPEQLHRLVVELFKYPIVVFSVLVALVLAQRFLGVRFGAVASIGPDGVSFVAHTDTLNARVLQITSQLADTRAALERLQHTGELGADSAKKIAAHLEQESFDGLQTVSDAQAKLSRSLSSDDNRPLLSGQDGWIWIGNYTPGSPRWEKPKIRPLAGGALPTPPEQINRDDEFLVSGNMVVRAGLPPNTTDYFLEQPSVGAIKRDTRVQALGQPQAVQRPYARQYWMKVHVVP
ncbi:hypothetical protein J421_3865 [Gemmatirosa kalamazoonensis]|uniref:Uncharacterized protein n=1 Tax=Gemmatirosa kalamazoonensis TaxID=861299 RepID=W0RLR9_9BACT|nr:hypothetical protein [Gemmatirosa kalamazoonensis]AHG91402.1 hypothetical protein J421_3865 [Gemmatirosa kalamazoonensis]